MTESQDRIPFILGLDLGSNSLGWAVIGLVNGSPAALVDAGVRIFPETVDKLEEGNDEPRNAKRRTARQMRRQTERRARRIATTFRLLQKFDLLPQFPEGANPDDPLARDAILKSLDRELERSVEGLIDPAQPHRSRSVLHYRLRALALHQDLPPFAIGRILLNLAQRRGFKSGRLEQMSEKDKAEAGQVQSTISSLDAAMRESGAATIGEFWSKLDPNDRRIRGWGNWSSRAMHVSEFDQIWERQASRLSHILTPSRYRILRRRIFYQRPLKSVAQLVGPCELEPTRRRAPLAHPLFQRFRILQLVNDLRVVQSGRPLRPLSADERARAIELLNAQQSSKFTALARSLGLPRGTTFTHEAGEREEAKGNVTRNKMLAVFGSRWDSLEPHLQSTVVGAVRSMDDKELLGDLGKKQWGLAPQEVARLTDTHLEPGYARLSLKALRLLLEKMESGTPYMTAVKECYPDRLRSTVEELLPPVAQFKAIRNPSVIRSLTELRKVVNAVIRLYGKPDRIQIELARELKKSKKARQAASKENKARRRTREKAVAQILKSCGLGNPSREDVNKAILWEESKHQCPYSGDSIGFCDLFGKDAKWEIEHIIPYSRSLNDSLANKTLCRRDLNRQKGNRTPWEAFGNTSQWDAMVERVSRFEGDRAALREKLALFTMRDDADQLFKEFTDRQLNDTKYASRQAAAYVSRLYGGLSDQHGTQRVFTVSGGITAQLRKGWRLHSILRDGPVAGDDRKPRDDHRHHAIDAAVVALTARSSVEALSRASAQSKVDHRRGFQVESPWSTFHQDLAATIESIIVSHRPDHRLRGALHDETILSPPRPSPDGGPERSRIRRSLVSLSKSMVNDIVDDTTRRLVREKLLSLGMDDPKKAFQDPANCPHLPNRHGSPVPIRKARVYVKGQPKIVGRGPKQRQVLTNENHHLAVYSQQTQSGPKWNGQAVSLLEAIQRRKSGAFVIRPNDDQGNPLALVLHKGDLVRIQTAETSKVFVVRGFSVDSRGAFDLTMAPHNAAGLKEDLKESGEWLRVRRWSDLQRLSPTVCDSGVLGGKLHNVNR